MRDVGPEITLVEGPCRLLDLEVVMRFAELDRGLRRVVRYPFSFAARAIVRPITWMPLSLSTKLNMYTDVQTMVRTNSDKLSPFALAMAFRLITGPD